MEGLQENIGKHVDASWATKASGNVGRLCSDSRTCERVCICMCVCTGGGQPAGMPANLAACAICLEVEKIKTRGCWECGRSRVPDGRGMGAASPFPSTQKQPSVLPPGCLSGGVALKGWTGCTGGSCAPAAASGSQPPTPRTPLLGTTETSAREVRTSPRAPAHAPLWKRDTGRARCLRRHGPACFSCSPACTREPPLPLTQLFQLGRHGLGTQRQGGAGRSLGRWRS